MKRTVSVLAEKDTGGLARIVSLLTRRRFQIESITMAACERKHYERIIIVLINQSDGEDASSQLTRQLKKLLNVVNVQDITYLPSVKRELILIKLQVNLIERAEILNLVQIFRLKIIDLTDGSLIIEVTADPGKAVALQKAFENYKVLELVRTGEIALTRESLVDTSSLNKFPYPLLDARENCI
uniref:acetolactate synthase small subunit n=1 Tax=Halosiphon tomentosus TaxID=64927 RepID=UPI002E79227D|nr:acetolactate synthase small subunit [Halosiphon tomentosus]WAM63758.1 acetolactate synthase small subunit [Halosiphon tomentosus]